MRKLRFWRTFAVLAAVAVSGFAVAALAAPSASPAKLCKAERADANFASTHSGKTFAQFYGSLNKNGKNAFGKCVSAKAKAKKQTTTAATTLAPTPTAAPTTTPAEDRASKLCKAEQADTGFAAAHGGKTFAQFYGAGKSQHNAFGKCVSSKAKPSAS